MNEIMAQMFLASLIKSVKNSEKKAKLRKIALESVKGLLLAYSDDPEFMDEVLD